MRKRMLLILLAVMMFSMDGVSLYANGLLHQAKAGLEAVSESKPGLEDDDDFPEGVGDGGTEEECFPGIPESEEPGIPEPEEPGASGEDPSQGKQEYAIYFSFAGGTTEDGASSITIQVPEGSFPNAGAVVMPQRKGYFFQGWLDENGAYYKFDQPITENIALLASWTPITYRVKFDLNGGEGQEIPEQIFTYDKEELLPTKIGKKQGYAFWGWRLKNLEFYPDGEPVKNLTDQDGAVVTLKAVWKRANYKVRFDANGGNGTMQEQSFVCGKSKNLNKNKYKRSGYVFTGWNTQKDGKGKSYADKEEVCSLSQEHGSTVVLFAMWQGNAYQVQYNGNGADSGTVGYTKHVYGTGSKLAANHFKKRGYTFAGWNTKANGTGKTYKAGEEVKELTTKADGVVTLYAKWTTTKYQINYKLKGGALPNSAKKSYTIASKTISLPAPKRNGYDFDGWYKDQSLKNRVKQINAGTVGDKTFYAKWVRCSKKPTKSAAKITACKASGTGKVKVAATIKSRILSDDDRYYLAYVNPVNGTPYRIAAESYKKKKVVFQLKTAQNQGYAVSMYGIAVKKNGKLKLISSSSYVKNPEKAASNKSKYKLGKTKKGMQFFQSMEEIDSCGAKNNFLNLTASMVCKNGAVPYQYNGKTYYFNRMTRYQEIVSECNKKGINVTMQVMLDWVDGNTDLIATKARKQGAAPYYTWNIYQNGAREKMEAIFCYLGSVFAKKNCYVSNWILGNEINNPGGWNYAGTLSQGSYFKTYAYAFRNLYYAIRSQYSNARIFICMDNLWNTAVPGGYSAKHSITSFVKQLEKIQRGIKWNLAYHAYSYPLTYTNFWEGFGISNKADTPYVTMKNLNVLTNYIKKKYGSSVRIILSEQGYSSTMGYANQAAALAYSYYIAACNPMIDAFIIRSYDDHPVEVAQGLRMGIKGKEAFKVYKYMDTSKSLKYTKRYLKMVGAKSWKKIVPGYKTNRIYKMYVK